MNKTCTSKYNKGLVFAVVSAVIFSLAIPTQTIADIVYAQGFANDTGSSAKLSDYGWYSYSNTNALNVSGNNRVAQQNGSAALTAVNADTPYGDNIPQGFYTAASGAISLAYVELALSGYTDISLSFGVRNSVDTSSTRFAIKVGSDWYVSETTYNQITSSFVTYSLDLLADTEFRAVNFTPSVELAISTDPVVEFGDIAGNITAVGFFLDPNHGGATTTMRVDNFIVTAIPEPATLGLLITSIAGVLSLRRVRRA
ncbi:MAG: PEP-CTERM sorting domain-containing protein [Kiritimatiellales bacterium]